MPARRRLRPCGRGRERSGRRSSSLDDDADRNIFLRDVLGPPPAGVPAGVTIDRLEAWIANKRLAKRTGTSARRSITLAELPAGRAKLQRRCVSGSI